MNSHIGREYPRAIVARASDDPNGTERAIAWLRARTRELGGTPLVYAAQRDGIDDDPILAAFTKTTLSATWRTLHQVHWNGGPVLAHWPDAKHLAAIDDDRRTRALCVMTWTFGDVEAWAAARQPERLTPGAVARTAAMVSDPVVEQGLLTLTDLVNHGNALTGIMDRRDAVNVLLILHDGGHALVPAEIYAWALAHQWPARGAERLKDLATRIQGGARPRADRTALTADALQQWRAAVRSGSGA